MENKESLSQKIDTLQIFIDHSHNIVFFCGAGVSTSSGIPDFRSQDGLYKQEYKYPPEEIISHHFFEENPEEFYRFYRNRMLFPDAKPNIVHQYIAAVSKTKNVHVVTQNIDGLDEMAGSKNVYELHGSVHRNYCMKCHKFYPMSYILQNHGIPYCSCGGIIKPDVVLYEEALDETVMQNAISAIHQSDLLIVLGTSLVVYPAAGLLRYFQGNNLVLINRDVTPYDHQADLLIHGELQTVFAKLKWPIYEK